MAIDIRGLFCFLDQLFAEYAGMDATSHAKTLLPGDMAYRCVYDFDLAFEAGTASVIDLIAGQQ